MRAGPRAIVLLGVWALCAGQAPEGEPAVHDCGLTRDGPFGQINVHRMIGPGGADAYRMSWQTPWRRPGVHVAMNWSRAQLGGPADDVPVQIYFTTGRRGTHNVRIEVDRPNRTAMPGELLFASDYRRSADDVFAAAQLGDLRRIVQGADGLAVSVVDRHRERVARDRIEAAWLGWPAAAVESVRAEQEALEADFRNRCPIHVHDPAEDI